MPIDYIAPADRLMSVTVQFFSLYTVNLSSTLSQGILNHERDILTELVFDTRHRIGE